MEQSIAQPRMFMRRPLTALVRVHLVALVCFSLTFVYLQTLVVGTFLPVPTILIAITLAVAGLVALGWR